MQIYGEKEGNGNGTRGANGYNLNEPYNFWWFYQLYSKATLRAKYNQARKVSWACSFAFCGLPFWQWHVSMSRICP